MITAFICYRSKDSLLFHKTVSEISEFERSIRVLHESDPDENWKNNVLEKLQVADIVIFVLGEDTFESEHVMWEFQNAKKLDKPIIGLKKSSSPRKDLLLDQGYGVFTGIDDYFKTAISTTEY